VDQFRRIFATIQTQAARLTVSQKLAIGSLAVVAAMTLLLVSLYAGRAEMVELLPGSTPEERTQAVAYLQSVGIRVVDSGGKVMVPAESKHAALAQLQQGRKLPSDTQLLFRNLADKQHWMMPRSQLDQLASQALMNELALVVSNFPGIDHASVFISSPEPRGLGAAARKPTANVTVHTRPGVTLSQETVNSLADLVAGATAGLDPADVRIIDSAKGRRYRAQSEDDLAAGASTYLEHVIKVEQRVQDKLADALRYIDGVIVTVNAQVDLSRRESRTHKVLPRGQGTESLIASETTSTTTQTTATAGIEPGVRPNTAMDISRSTAGPATGLSEEHTETTFENAVGTRTDVTFDPKGRPTKINATVSVPRTWAEQLARQRRAAGGPGGAGANADAPLTEAEVLEAWKAEEERLTRALQPLVETAATESPDGASGGVVAGTVVVSMIPVAVPGLGSGLIPDTAGGGLLGSASGALGTIASWTGVRAGSALIKTVALSVLAVIALGMMVLMVRKAARPEPLPTPEELTGIPPPIAASLDIVGEAAEGDTAIEGIEIDDSSLRSKKMLEQVSELIKKDPTHAATLFNRWVSTES
jgi:flagellar biosynthesis/type III secretory pathway M-ring protein FliF/YscJ